MSKNHATSGIEVCMILSPQELDALRRIVWRLADHDKTGPGLATPNVVRSRAIGHLRRAIIVAQEKKS